jgi:hypothetical protein
MTYLEHSQCMKQQVRVLGLEAMPVNQVRNVLAVLITA